MYKVFFNDRTVFFGDDFSKAFLKHKGLFYKYNNYNELNETDEAYPHIQKIIDDYWDLTNNIEAQIDIIKLHNEKLP